MASFGTEKISDVQDKEVHPLTETPVQTPKKRGRPKKIKTEVDSQVFDALGLQLSNIIQDEDNLADQLDKGTAKTAWAQEKSQYKKANNTPLLPTRSSGRRNIVPPKRLREEGDEVFDVSSLIKGVSHKKETGKKKKVLDKDLNEGDDADDDNGLQEIGYDDSDFDMPSDRPGRGRPKSGKAKSSKKGKMPAKKGRKAVLLQPVRSRFLFTGNCPLCQRMVEDGELVTHFEEECTMAGEQDDIVIKREIRKKIRINNSIIPTPEMFQGAAKSSVHSYPLRKSVCLKRGIPLPKIEVPKPTKEDAELKLNSQVKIIDGTKVVEIIDTSDDRATEQAVNRLAKSMFNKSSVLAKCKLCSKEFANTRRLREHIRFHIRPWKCDICDKIFQSNTALKYHSAIHTGERKHLCETCGRSFRQSSALISHIRTHTGQRPYACTMCDKRFTVSSALYVHMRRHTGTKLHQCDICGMQFHESAPMRYHRNSHTGERPYKCDKCGRAYTRPDKLRLHNCPGNPDRFPRQQLNPQTSFVYQTKPAETEGEMPPTTQILVATGTNDETGAEEYQTVEVAWTNISNIAGPIGEATEQPVVSLVELAQ